MTYTVNFKASAAKKFAKLSRDVQQRLKPAIDGLAENPRPNGVEKLTDEDNLYRLRVGDYRIVFTIRDAELVVLVVALGDRKEIYRLFK